MGIDNKFIAVPVEAVIDEHDYLIRPKNIRHAIFETKSIYSTSSKPLHIAIMGVAKSIPNLGYTLLNKEQLKMAKYLLALDYDIEPNYHKFGHDVADTEGISKAIKAIDDDYSIYYWVSY